MCHFFFFCQSLLFAFPAKLVVVGRGQGSGVRTGRISGSMSSRIAVLHLSLLFRRGGACRRVTVCFYLLRFLRRARVRPSACVRATRRKARIRALKSKPDDKGILTMLRQLRYLQTGGGEGGGGGHRVGDGRSEKILAAGKSRAQKGGYLEGEKLASTNSRQSLPVCWQQSLLARCSCCPDICRVAGVCCRCVSCILCVCVFVCVALCTAA